MRSVTLLWTAMMVLIALLGRRVASQITGCFQDTACTSLVTEGSFTDIDSCCVAETSLAYSSGGSCTECVVIGWRNNEIDLMETGQPMNVELGYVKGSPPAGLVRLQSSVIDGTATRSLDYTPPLDASFFFSNTRTMETLAVSAQGDQVSQEGTETFILMLDVATGFAIPAGVSFRSSLTVNIIDSTVVTISWTDLDYAAPEATAMMSGFIQTNIQIAAPITVTVTPLTYTQAANRGFQRPAGNLPVDCETNDFDTTPFDVTIPISTGPINIVNVVVDVIDDLRDEPQNEGFLAVLELGSAQFPDLVQFNPTTRVTLGRVLDNDDTLIGFELSSYTFPEQNTNTQQTIRLNKETMSDLTVMVVVSVLVGQTPPGAQSATVDQDYQLIESVIYTFSPSETSADVSFTVLADQTVERREGLVLRVVGADGSPTVLPGINPTTNVFIEDNDGVTIGFELTTYTTSEPNSGIQTTLEICMVLTEGQLGKNVFVVPEFVDGTAQTGVPSQGGDYLPEASPQFTFSPTVSRSCVNVFVFDDSIAEGTETIIVQVEGLRDTATGTLMSSLPGVTINPSTTRIEIEDNDNVVVELDPIVYSVTEGTDRSVTFRIVKRTISTRSVEVLFSTRDITALASGDYTSRDITVTFAPSNTEQEVEVQITNDIVYEGAEEFEGRVSLPLGSEGVTLGMSVATVSIMDDDSLTIGFEQSSYTTTEPSTGSMNQEVCIVITSGELGQSITIQPEFIEDTAQENADYRAPTGNFMFQSGTSRACLFITLLSDIILEEQEQLTGRLRGVVSNGGMVDQDPDRITFDPRETTVFIDDNANEHVVVELDPIAYRVTEGTDCSVTFRIVKRTLSTRSVEVLFSTRDITALASGDYTSRDITVTFAPSVMEQEVEVQITNDGVYEGTEEFEGRVSLPLGSEGVTLGMSVATVSITDDDSLTIGFEQSSYATTKPSTGSRDQEVCIVITSGELGQSITIQPEFTQGTALENEDYRAPTCNFMLQLGTPRPGACLSITLLSDDIPEEQEQLTGRLRGVVSDGGMVDQNPARITFEPRETIVLINNDVNERVTTVFEHTTNTTSEPNSGIQLSHQEWVGISLVLVTIHFLF